MPQAPLPPPQLLSRRAKVTSRILPDPRTCIRPLATHPVTGQLLLAGYGIPSLSLLAAREGQPPREVLEGQADVVIDACFLDQERLIYLRRGHPGGVGAAELVEYHLGARQARVVHSLKRVVHDERLTADQAGSLLA